VALAAAMQTSAIVLNNLLVRSPALVPLPYLNVLLAMAVSLWWLLRARVRARSATAPAAAG
jgi:hypothetical protein